ncbi:ABC transporter ATP-binding protein [Desulfovibrio sp. SGI.169]|uniref:ABC transporter ATP-binding protein n=1 Tax=Desulfovibrio sp. SGI.169 TaxID=3420561 RepID=UPI003D00AAC5
MSFVTVDISKRFGKMDVLQNVSFTVSKNEFLVIVGPTGCGKSTIANILAGIEAPTAGLATIHGEQVNPKKHNISFVFQEPSCVPWKTLLEDVMIGPTIKNIPADKAAKRAAEVIELVGLTGFETYYSRQLSGGMQQRVAIARAYVTDPDLLIMDEPFGHLDAQTRYLMQGEIMRIWQQEHKTVIFITNNIEEAVFLASRIVVLSKLPASIKGIYDINLPHPRNLTDPEFLRLREMLTDMCEATD